MCLLELSWCLHPTLSAHTSLELTAATLVAHAHPQTCWRERDGTQRRSGPYFLRPEVVSSANTCSLICGAKAQGARTAAGSDGFVDDRVLSAWKSFPRGCPHHPFGTWGPGPLGAMSTGSTLMPFTARATRVRGSLSGQNSGLKLRQQERVTLLFAPA